MNLTIKDGKQTLSFSLSQLKELIQQAYPQYQITKCEFGYGAIGYEWDVLSVDVTVEEPPKATKLKSAAEYFTDAKPSTIMDEFRSQQSDNNELGFWGE